MSKSTSGRIAIAVLFAVAIAIGSLANSATSAQTQEGDVDRVFAKWSATAPGCAVGVSQAGKPVLTKAYGLANLEHGVANKPETIFEAGSVSKQFTAAAVLLLAKDGKLSLEDPVRKYIPELPDYGAALTIRHLLNHSSGLRDWGSVASIGGWPRTTRAYTHAHVLEIASRQRATNFTPGTRYSYSNTGYNLSAILVSRVSGMSFSEFSQQRLFKPLGMTHTSWRDDHRRIVKDRAIAYSDEGGNFRTLMPFENVHGNGGLLTTVGDLLKWNQNFSAPTIGDAAFVTEQERAGRFNDGRAHGYALGLMVGSYKGVRVVQHSGSTAGYRAHLSRYPDQQLSVAVLCNVSSGNATQYANAVADIYLGDRIKPAGTLAAKHSLTPPELANLTGLYRSTLTGETVTIARTDNGVRFQPGPTWVAMTATRFATPGADTLEFDGRGGVRTTDSYGTVEAYERVQPAKATTAQLQELVGTYTSADAETTLTVSLDGDALVLKRRPDATIKLTPIYADAFSGQIGTVIFRREGGRVTAFSIVQDRVWDMRFTRQAGTATSSQ